MVYRRPFTGVTVTEFSESVELFMVSPLMGLIIGRHGGRPSREVGRRLGGPASVRAGVLQKRPIACKPTVRSCPQWLEGEPLVGQENDELVQYAQQPILTDAARREDHAPVSP